MNYQVMKKWVKALRSGKYKQGKEKLYDPITDTYCVMGVLAYVLNQPLSVDHFRKIYKTPKGPAVSLMFLNDKGLSFKQIANIIEKNWRDL